MYSSTEGFYMDFFYVLGVPLTHEKTAEVVTFLGTEMATIVQTSKLPVDKLEALQSHVTYFLGRSKITLKELQQLVGCLNFAYRVVALGRAFL